MIDREYYLKKVSQYLEIFPICGIVGPRQCGKTTLALQYAKTKTNFAHYDLEDPSHYEQFKNPKLLLEDFEGLLIIDEIQRMPELFLYLRVLADKNKKIKILILGSASPKLLEKSSETLAGRIGYIELTPFSLSETKELNKLWIRGGFPKSFLANTFEASIIWRKEYIKTFLERELSMLGFNVSHQTMRRLWVMLSHYHGNILNFSELGRSLGISDTSVRKYLDILEHSFMLRTLKPWYENIKKRQVKSPKVYLRDTGILHSLLGINTDIKMHPKSGASWEGLALEEIIKAFNIDSNDCYFWRTQDGYELDLLIYKNNKKVGIEFKYTDKPQITSSMKTSINSLNLDNLFIITPISETYKLSKEIKISSLENFITNNYLNL